jgi:hypothetical protein
MVRRQVWSALCAGAFLLFAASSHGQENRNARLGYVPFDGERTTWHDGFDRYDFVMDDGTGEITPIKAPDKEVAAFGIDVSLKDGKRRCVVVVLIRPPAGRKRQPGNRSRHGGPGDSDGQRRGAGSSRIVSGLESSRRWRPSLQRRLPPGLRHGFGKMARPLQQTNPRTELRTAALVETVRLVTAPIGLCTRFVKRVRLVSPLDSRESNNVTTKCSAVLSDSLEFLLITGDN